MRITSPVVTAALVTLTLAGISHAQDAAPEADSSSSHSRIRIVRLSEVKGEVMLDRLTGQGFEPAMANLPVVEGEKLKTGNGVAEIEFEDNSTVRVAQDSTVAFPRLEMLPGGAKASTLTVLQGTVYVSLINTKGNQFVVNAGQQKIDLPPDSHIRLQLAGNQADLAVLHGEAQVEQASGTSVVDKKKTMTFNLDGQGEPVVAKSVAEAPLDDWDKNAVQYHKSFANVSSFGNTPYSYGLSDLNYYGSFGNFGGCGSMWRPYFAGAAWDPYSSGAWAYYPSAGYSWVSPYPWGWTPYHYGSWQYCSGVGWGWQPGGPWFGLSNSAFLVKPGTGGTLNHPRPPLHPPVASQSSMTLVNMKTMPTSTLSKNETFVFRQDSAGLGVPRGTLGKLNGFSHETAQHGAATTGVYLRGAAEGGSHGAPSAYSASSAGRLGTASSNHSSYSGGMQSMSSSGGSHASAGGGGVGGGGGGGGRH